MQCNCPHLEIELRVSVSKEEPGTPSYICKNCGAEVPGPAVRAWKELGLRIFHGCQN